MCMYLIKCFKFYEAKTDGSKSRNRSNHDYDWKFPLVINKSSGEKFAET